MGVTASKKDIDAIISDVFKKFGDDAIADMSLMQTDHPSISTGFPTIDAITGCGGFPKGRLSELYGPEHSGKSTLSIHTAANAQKDGGLVIYVDFEHSFDPRYAKKLGVNVDDKSKFLLIQPRTLEEGMSIASRFIRAGVASLVIVDSVAAGVPSAEVEGEDVGTNRIGLHSLVWANVLKQLTHDVHASDCVLLGINQVRTRIGITFGSGEDTPGGKAFKHYASLRMKLVKEKGIMGRYVDEIGANATGQIAMKVRVETVKNKLAAPFRQTTLHLRHGEGFDVILPAIEDGLVRKVLNKTRQGWIEWGSGEDQVKLRGDDRFREYLKENPEELARLIKQNSETEIPSGEEIDF